MPTAAAIDSASLAALAAGKPFAVGSNILKNRTSVFWKEAPTSIGHVNDALYPPWLAYDDKLTDYTQPDDAIVGQPDAHLVVTLDANYDFDCWWIKFANADTWSHNYTVSLSLMNAGFLTGPGVVESFTALAGTNAKWIFPTVDGEGWTGVRYLYITFAAVGGTVVELPAVAEVGLGTRRQFAHHPRLPYDSKPRQSATQDFVANSGAIGRNVLFEGQANLGLRFKPHPANIFSIDELEAFRALFRDCNHGTRPFLWVDNTTGFDAGGTLRPSGYWVYMPEPRLVAPYVNQTAAEVEIEALELPPFQSAEVLEI